jgi:hypothetical protein
MSLICWPVAIYIVERGKNIWRIKKTVLPLHQQKQKNNKQINIKIMKKIIFILLALVTIICLPIKADNDRVITFDQLPQKAQALLKKNFENKVPLVITADWDDYKVMYQSGEKVEFDKNGEWKEIECKTSMVPVELIPEQIKAHVNATFPGTTIIKLDRDRRGYSVKLNNGMEPEYNKQFQLIGLDD